MSDESDVMESLGLTNKRWGVCGFTSSFYAMFDQGTRVKGQLINATRAYRVLAEIKTYLQTLRANGKTAMIKDIEKFTRSFGGKFKKFTVEKYIKNINAAAQKKLDEDEILKDPKYGIAMPPQAVANYIESVCEEKASAQAVVGNMSYAECIVGVAAAKSRVGKNFTKTGPYSGLKHYLYCTNNKYYSWGETFPSIQSAMDETGKVTWRAVWVIKIG